MKRITTYLFAVAFVVTCAVSPMATAADTSYEARSAAWWTNLSKQLTLSLNSPIDQVKTKAMQHVNFFATHYGEKAEMGLAVPELLKIYETDESEAYRIMALAALHAIDDPATMRYLSEIVRYEKSTRVRQLTLAALADHVQRHPAS